jgi:hypothetical protein
MLHKLIHPKLCAFLETHMENAAADSVSFTTVFIVLVDYMLTQVLSSKSRI